MDRREQRRLPEDIEGWQRTAEDDEERGRIMKVVEDSERWRSMKVGGGGHCRTTVSVLPNLFDEDSVSESD